MYKKVHYTCSAKFKEFYSRLFLTFQKWTKKMSIFRFPKIVCSKYKFVTIKIFMLSSMKKVFKFCDDKFFFIL